MDQATKIIQLESEVKTLKEQVDFINKRFGLVPDEKEFFDGLNHMIATRSTEKLDDYYKRGGKTPVNHSKELAA